MSNEYFNPGSAIVADLHNPTIVDYIEFKTKYALSNFEVPEGKSLLDMYDYWRSCDMIALPSMLTAELVTHLVSAENFNDAASDKDDETPKNEDFEFETRKEHVAYGKIGTLCDVEVFTLASINGLNKNSRTVITATYIGV